MVPPDAYPRAVPPESHPCDSSVTVHVLVRALAPVLELVMTAHVRRGHVAYAYAPYFAPAAAAAAAADGDDMRAHRLCGVVLLLRHRLCVVPVLPRPRNHDTAALLLLLVVVLLLVIAAARMPERVRVVPASGGY